MERDGILICRVVGFGLVLVLACGCNKSSPVAIVDLDKVAKELGIEQQMVGQIEKTQNNLNQQLTQHASSLQEQLNVRVSKMGESPTVAQNAELSEMKNRVKAQLASNKQVAQNSLNTLQLDLIRSFREKLQPVALRLAKDEGCKVVLSKNDTVVFAYDESIDITDKVIRELSKAPLQKQSEATSTKK